MPGVHEESADRHGGTDGQTRVTLEGGRPCGAAVACAECVAHLGQVLHGSGEVAQGPVGRLAGGAVARNRTGPEAQLDGDFL